MNLALRISIFEGTLAVFINQLFGGVYLTGYFLWMGASPFLIGLFGSIPSLASALQILPLLFAHRLNSRKQLIVPLMWIARTGIATFALFPILKGGLFLSYAMYMYIQIAGAISSPLWQSWMADLVPKHSIGSYFGLRNFVLGVVQIPAMFIAGIVLDALGENTKGFSVLFLLAGLAGFLNGYLLKIQHEPVYRIRESSIGPVTSFKLLMHNKQFKNLMLSFAIWYFAVGFGSVYINVMLLKEIQFSYLQVSILNAVAMFIGTLFQPFWGKAGDKYGFQNFLKMCIWVQAFLILFWGLTPKSFLYVFLLQIFIGIFVTAGSSQLIFYTLMYIAPADLRTEAFSIFNSFSNIALTLGSLISGIIVSSLSNFGFKVFYLNVTSIRLTMFISFCLRILAAYTMSKADLGSARKVPFFELVRESFTTAIIPWMRSWTNIWRKSK
ncbi:major facilitator superfamily MFS_1 [Pseudothermotoga lettingae TMO]|uniref:Major facilitator superfamily MFS_1 n=1 Tax=Pseudothermotoga lettingae (strain ATCC BAA-301 / DSM 14385 / NBRC 107922 / TMO) TaxID=416591 RepID=A8F7G3_PSELT|nr:major facilitator superfamily MFS_1 [Pseudothermotoga lettingae TMO]